MFFSTNDRAHGLAGLRQSTTFPYLGIRSANINGPLGRPPRKGDHPGLSDMGPLAPQARAKGVHHSRVVKLSFFGRKDARPRVSSSRQFSPNGAGRVAFISASALASVCLKRDLSLNAEPPPKTVLFTNPEAPQTNAMTFPFADSVTVTRSGFRGGAGLHLRFMPKRQSGSFRSLFASNWRWRDRTQQTHPPLNVFVRTSTAPAFHSLQPSWATFCRGLWIEDDRHIGPLDAEHAL